MIVLLLRRKTSQTHQIDLIEMLIPQSERHDRKDNKRTFAADYHKQENGEQTRNKRLSVWHVSQAVYYPT